MTEPVDRAVHLTLNLSIFLAYYICCIISNALHNTFIMEANTMNPSSSAAIINQQKRKQTRFIMNDPKGLKKFNAGQTRTKIDLWKNKKSSPHKFHMRACLLVCLI